MSLSRCLARDARYRHLRLVRILPPHPPEPTLEERLRATVLELWSRKWLLLACCAALGTLAFVVGSDGGRPVPVVEFIPMSEIARDYAFRGGFDAADDVPRWTEISFSTDGVTQ